MTPEAMEQIDYGYSATAKQGSAQVIQIESLGKGGIATVVAACLICVALSCLAIGLAWRAIDRAQIAEREARVAVDQMQAARIELAQAGILKPLAHH